MTPAQLPVGMKRFSVSDANRMLPLVQRIVSDIVRDYWRWQAAVREFEIASLRSSAERVDDVADNLQREAIRLAEAIEGYMGEMNELGVQLKGFETGIVDFPGEIGGRPVSLCWQLGESAVSHWHEEDAGFAGRQPLPQMDRVETGMQ